MRQSKEVGTNSWAIRRSECSSISLILARSAASSSSLKTPRLNEPSGILSTIGRPRWATSSPACLSLWTITVFGVGDGRPHPAARRDRPLLVQRIIDWGSSDDRHAFLLGAPCEAIGEVVDRGRRPDPQRIKLRYPVEIALLDRFDID